MMKIPTASNMAKLEDEEEYNNIPPITNLKSILRVKVSSTISGSSSSSYPPPDIEFGEAANTTVPPPPEGDCPCRIRALVWMAVIMLVVMITLSFPIPHPQMKSADPVTTTVPATVITFSNEQEEPASILNAKTENKEEINMEGRQVVTYTYRSGRIVEQVQNANNGAVESTFVYRDESDMANQKKLRQDAAAKSDKELQVVTHQPIKLSQFVFDPSRLLQGPPGNGRSSKEEKLEDRDDTEKAISSAISYEEPDDHNDDDGQQPELKQDDNSLTWNEERGSKEDRFDREMLSSLFGKLVASDSTSDEEADDGKHAEETRQDDDNSHERTDDSKGMGVIGVLDVLPSVPQQASNDIIRSPGPEDGRSGTGGVVDDDDYPTREGHHGSEGSPSVSDSSSDDEDGDTKPSPSSSSATGQEWNIARALLEGFDQGSKPKLSDLAGNGVDRNDDLID